MPFLFRFEFGQFGRLVGDGNDLVVDDGVSVGHFIQKCHDVNRITLANSHVFERLDSRREIDFVNIHQRNALNGLLADLDKFLFYIEVVEFGDFIFEIKGKVLSQVVVYFPFVKQPCLQLLVV